MSELRYCRAMSDLQLKHVDFWDVGQGDCSVMVFDDESLVIIDTGPKGSPLVDWLSDRPKRIRSIILTHNDSDHAGALSSVLAGTGSTIEAIHLLVDRPIKSPPFQKLFSLAMKGEAEGRYQLQRLEADKVIFTDSAGIRLRVVHPSFSENVMASSPNDASALLVLEKDQEWLAVWPGDLSLKIVAEQVGNNKPCVMVGPHHGAPKGHKRGEPGAAYTASISPRNTFISVGTNNRYDHPRPRYLTMLGRLSTRIRCSQLTRVCDTRQIHTGIPVFNGAAMLGLRPSRTGTACRGAWRLSIKNGEVSGDHFESEHLSRVAKLRRPQCLKAFGWTAISPKVNAPTGFGTD